MKPNEEIDPLEQLYREDSGDFGQEVSEPASSVSDLTAPFDASDVDSAPETPESDSDTASRIPQDSEKEAERQEAVVDEIIDEQTTEKERRKAERQQKRAETKKRKSEAREQRRLARAERKKTLAARKKDRKLGQMIAKRVALSFRGRFTPLFYAVLFLICGALLLRYAGSFRSAQPAVDPRTQAENDYFVYLEQEESRLAAESEALANAPVELGDSIFSRYAIMIRCTDGRVMCTKNADELMYPASITKLMTVLVAIDLCFHPDTDVLEVMPDVIEYCQSENASVAGLKAGEHLTVTQLLYCTVLPSGADAALTLANGLCENEAAFVKKMNEKAAALGMSSTHFSNVVGLHDKEHYTTARDLATMVTAGLENPTFRALISAMRYYIPATDMHPDGFTVISTIKNSMKTYGVDCPYIQGGKTGFTYEAGQCLAAYSRCNGYDFVTVTGNSGSTNYCASHVQDVVTMLSKFVLKTDG